MARSPIFLFAVLITIAVAMVMSVGMMKLSTPTNGTYSVAGSSANLTSGMISRTMDIAPNWVLPAILLSMALAVIAVMFLMKRK